MVSGRGGGRGRNKKYYYMLQKLKNHNIIQWKITNIIKNSWEITKRMLYSYNDVGTESASIIKEDLLLSWR